MPIGDPGTLYTYQITFVPLGCKQYAVGQIIRVQAGNPPPATITLNYGGACNGVIATLVP